LCRLADNICVERLQIRCDNLVIGWETACHTLRQLREH
jgi:hypothetical protein